VRALFERLERFNVFIGGGIQGVNVNHALPVQSLGFDNLFAQFKWCHI